MMMMRTMFSSKKMCYWPRSWTKKPPKWNSAQGMIRPIQKIISMIFVFLAKQTSAENTVYRRGQISSAFRKRKSLCISNAWNMASFEFRSAKECSRAELICMIKVALGQSLAEPILWFAWNYKGFLFLLLQDYFDGKKGGEKGSTIPISRWLLGEFSFANW